MNDQKTVCDAHVLLLQTVERIQDGQEKLYNLDRDKAEELSEIKTSMARMEASTGAGFETIAEQIESLRKMIVAQNTRHWKPGHIVALAGSFFGSAGIVLAAWISRGAKP
jgi:hypothetical protein